MGQGAESLATALGRKTTLYFSASAGEIAQRGKCLVVLKGEEVRQSFPLAEIRRVSLLGRARMPAEVLYLLLRRGVPVDWLDNMGRPLGQLLTFAEDHAANLCKQAAFQNSAAALVLTKIILLVKLENCHKAIMRRIGKQLPWRDRKLALIRAADEESLRGAEGIAAKMYFGMWPDLIKPFAWHGRHAHPAPDPVNMLLSLGYGLVHNRLASALQAAGLNPRIGFFHASRGRHCALASDLMEPFRAMVDATVLNLLRRKEIRPEEFQMRGSQCVCREQGLFVKLLGWFEEMFCHVSKFYPAAEDNHQFVERSLNDALDDLALSYASYLTTGEAIFLPRLEP